MDPIRKIPKKFTKKSGNKVINRQYFCRKTGLQDLFQKCWKLKYQQCAANGPINIFNQKKSHFFRFVVFQKIKVPQKIIQFSIFLWFFNKFWKSWNQIFQNWSYLCTLQLQKSTKRPIFLTIFGTKKSNLKKSLAGGTRNWLVWTHFWIPYDIWVLKMGVCTQEATVNVFQSLT